MILPRENEPDLEELPPETREAIEFVLVDSVEEVFEAAFDRQRGPHAGGAPQRWSDRRRRARLRRARIGLDGQSQGQRGSERKGHMAKTKRESFRRGEEREAVRRARG